MHQLTRIVLIFCLTLMICALSSHENDGREFLIRGQFGQPSLNDEMFENLWLVWDGEDATKAAHATPEQRRALAFKRYGFVTAPFENDGLPMGFTKSASGIWYDNCLLCHGGSVLGQSVIGAPNNRLDLTTLSEDIFLLSTRSHRPVVLPSVMNQSKGVTNAVIFGHELLKFRDKDLDLLDTPVDLGLAIDHDLDAPALWNVKYKSRLYFDGFVPKDARALTQFTMIRQNSGDTIRQMLPDFEKVLTFLESIESPRYPGKTDKALAQKGQSAFESRCASCHGTYGHSRQYPNRLIPKDVVNTDPVRLVGLTPEFRAYYLGSWLGHYGELDIRLQGEGYVAPPLNGIWASAPYFHNGSVPTLYHVLYPSKRPKVWRVGNYESYDHEKVGLVIDEFERLPMEELAPSDMRRFYDTSQFSKSNQGHPFANLLSDDDKIAVLEYLKTL